MNISLFPFAPENLVSRDGFGSPVPRQPAHFHTQAESGAYLRDSSRVPRRRPFIYYERSELPIDGDGKKTTQKKARKRGTQKNTIKNVRRRCIVQRSFRRAIASSVHTAAVGSA